MAPANRNLLKGELSNGTGQVDGEGAEAEADCSVGLLDAVWPGWHRRDLPVGLGSRAHR